MSLTLTYNTDTLFNSIKVQQTDNGKYYKYTNIQNLYLTKGVTYEIKYKLYVQSPNLILGNTTIASPFDLYITSSGNNQKAFEPSDILGYSINAVTASYNTFTEKSHLIIPQYDGTGSLCFAFKYGTYYIADIIVQPYSDIDNSVEEMRIRIPTPPIKRYESISLYPIYIGGNNNPVGDVNLLLSEGGQAGAFSAYQVVTGSNLVIDSDDNLVMGALYVGSTLRTGVEISGYASALIRSIGYEGFYSASTYGNSGFMLYSGSVLSGSGDYYRGVGLELHAGYNNGSLRYRVDDSGSFLEISGNLYATNGYFSGTISASTGEIGGWTINDNSIFSSKVTASKVTLYSIQTSSGYEFSGLIISTSYGYSGFVSQTGSSEGALIFVGSNYEYSASNAPFYVLRNGYMYASGGLFEGTLSASKGNIAGWNISNNLSTADSAVYNAIYSDNFQGTKVSLISMYDRQSGPFIWNFSGLIISSSNYGYSGFVYQTGSTDGALLFVGSNNMFSASNAPFYVNRDGFFKTTYGEIGNWKIHDNDFYSDLLGSQRVVFTALDEGGSPAVFSGIYMSSSYAGYSGFVVRNSLDSNKPFFFINSPVLYEVGPSFPKLKDSAIWMTTDGTLVAQHIIASQSLVASCSIYCSADIYAEDDIVAFSDKRLKKDIVEITSSMDIISKLNGVKFRKISNDNKERIGLIAQDVEEYLPQVVKTNNDGYKAINYGNIVALLIEGIKEQQKEIEELKKQVNLLKNK